MRPRTKKLEAIAYHEAGHAVAGYLLNVSIVEVSIIREDGNLGHCSYVELREQLFQERQERTARNVLEPRIISALAGGYAEKRFTGRWNEQGMAADLGGVIQDCQELVGVGPDNEEPINTYVYRRLRRTRRLLENPANWNAVTTLANELLEHDRLSARKVQGILKQVPDIYIRKDRSYTPAPAP